MNRWEVSISWVEAEFDDFGNNSLNWKDLLVFWKSTTGYIGTEWAKDVRSTGNFLRLKAARKDAPGVMTRLMTSDDVLTWLKM